MKKMKSTKRVLIRNLPSTLSLTKVTVTPKILAIAGLTKKPSTEAKSARNKKTRAKLPAKREEAPTKRKRNLSLTSQYQNQDPKRAKRKTRLLWSIKLHHGLKICSMCVGIVPAAPQAILITTRKVGTI